MVHRSVHDELERRFSGGGGEDPEGLTREDLEPFGGEEMLGYLDTRTETVISLVDEVATAASSGGADFAVLDLCGAEKGFATGRPEGEAASALGWQMGIDQAALADVCDTVAVTGYAADPDRLSLDLDAYQTFVPEASRLGLVLRPMPPDCRSAENLATKVALARERGLGRLDFYHYGFCRLEALDWIRQALAT